MAKTLDNAKDLFIYDESSPTFLRWTHHEDVYHKVRGKPAGGLKKRRNGKPKNAEVFFSGSIYIIHRIIWEMLIGEIHGCNVIDHIDGNPHNNCISNLRETTQKVNSQNRTKRFDNVTGKTGVCWLRNRKTKLKIYAKSEVQDGLGGNLQKVFSVKTHGEEKVFQLACEWRDDMLKYLNASGQQYTERHGK